MSIRHHRGPTPREASHDRRSRRIGDTAVPLRIKKPQVAWWGRGGPTGTVHLEATKPPILRSHHGGRAGRSLTRDLTRGKARRVDDLWGDCVCCGLN